MRWLLTVLMGALSMAAQSDGLKEGMSFLQARKSLVREGWQPRKVHTNDGYQFIGTEKTLLQSGIDEVESCAIDHPYCIFNYRKGASCLRVITIGERTKDLKINRWTNDCPE